MQRLLIRFALCLSLTHGLTTPSSAAETVDKSPEPQAERKKFVPPGFELLLEPQTTQVDIY